MFVDDDAGFLSNIRQVFSDMARGSWRIHTAENHSQALALLRQHRMDVVVLDLDMPVMDGLQFLRLLNRTHPGQQVVILTGQANPEKRQACLDSGAVLFLEKLITPTGFSAVFSTLDALASSAPSDGFRGMMRRVGLQEVLQMECLGRKSSILEVFTSRMRGRIYISDGGIVHAESGALQGEVALYGILGLTGGEFNLLPFSEPAQRTISGHYEFLLMEAARLNDENAAAEPSGETPPATEETPPVADEPAPDTAPAPSLERAEVEEILLCSGAGELLYEQGVRSLDRRLKLFSQVEEQGAHLSRLLPAGRFERLEIATPDGRYVCQVQPHVRLLVRTTPLLQDQA